MICPVCGEDGCTMQGHRTVTDVETRGETTVCFDPDLGVVALHEDGVHGD